MRPTGPIRRARIIHGYRMIVRHDIARICRFDENLSAGLHEDLDASYRFAQQGAEAIYMSLDQSKKFIGDEIIKYHDIITKAGVAQID